MPLEQISLITMIAAGVVLVSIGITWVVVRTQTAFAMDFLAYGDERDAVDMKEAMREVDVRFGVIYATALVLALAAIFIPIGIDSLARV